MQLELELTHDERDACLRCGAHLRRRPTGRPKVWCTPECRRLAYQERLAAENGAIAIRVIERVEQVPINECVERVIASPVACAKVLNAVAGLIDDGQIHQPKWSKTLTGLGELLAVIRRVNRR